MPKKDSFWDIVVTVAIMILLFNAATIGNWISFIVFIALAIALGVNYFGKKS